MTAKVQRLDQGLGIVLTPEMIDAYDLHEGSEVEITLTASTQMTYATDEEVLRSFEKTLPRHDGAYRALAK